MLFPQNIAEHAGINWPEGYTIRMVKRCLPNINVLRYFDATDKAPRAGLRCGFTVSIWSTDAKDMATNLADAMTPEGLKENTLRELRCFEFQLPPIKAQVELLRAEIDLLLRILRPASPPVDFLTWHRDWAQDRPELRDAQKRLQQRETALKKFNDEDWGNPVPAEYGALSHVKALAMTENLRKTIATTRDRIDLLEDVQASLTCYQSGNARTERPAHEYVALDVLSRGNARQRKAKEAILKELGIAIPARLADGDLPPI